MNSWFERLSMFWKLIAIYLVIIVLLSISFIWMLYQVGATHELVVSAEGLSFVKDLFFRSLGIASVGILIFFTYVYFAFKNIIHRGNTLVHDVLQERRLDKNFDDLYSAKTFAKLMGNMETVFKLFRQFDLLKSSRVALEVASIKSIINQASDGIIMVNQDNVVTYINHTGEKLLKLIPGEAEGQILSRKVSNEAILDSIHKALHKGLKTIECPISLAENAQNLLSVVPIQNKQGDNLRAVVIVHKTKTPPSSKEKETETPRS